MSTFDGLERMGFSPFTALKSALRTAGAPASPRRSSFQIKDIKIHG
jgi:hypothetical protein